MLAFSTFSYVNIYFEVVQIDLAGSKVLSFKWKPDHRFKILTHAFQIQPYISKVNEAIRSANKLNEFITVYSISENWRPFVTHSSFLMKNLNFCQS